MVYRMAKPQTLTENVISLTPSFLCFAFPLLLLLVWYHRRLTSHLLTYARLAEQGAWAWI